MSEIGVIGATYEDRRTKKQGKLIERDEKFKTLLMESEDGKSFNITFGGFKSNWRKVDEPEPTIEEAMQEEVPEEQISLQKKEEPIKKKKQVKRTIELAENDVNPVFEDAVILLSEYGKSFNSANLLVRPQISRELIAVNIKGRKFIEVFRKPRTSHYTIACKEPMAKFAGDIDYANSLKFYPTRKPLNYAFKVDVADFGTFLNDLRPIIIDMLSESVEEGK